MEHTETSKISAELNKIYIALAILAILFIGLAAYTIVQVNELNASSQNNNNMQLSVLSSQLLALQQEVAAMRGPVTTTTQPAPGLKMQFLYDSSDSFTSDALSTFQQSLPTLTAQGIQVNAVDVAGNTSWYYNHGYRSLPAIFIDGAQLANNPQLAQTLQSQALVVKDGFAIDPYGSITDSKTILATNCSIPGKLSVSEFVDYSCPTCFGPDNALDQVVAAFNGSIHLERDFLVNNALFPLSQNASIAVFCASPEANYNQYRKLVLNNSANLTEAGLVHFASQLGFDMNKFNSCLSNPSSLGAVSQTSNVAWVTYGINGNTTIVNNYPSLVVNCMNVFPASNATQIQQGFCRADSTWCANVHA